MNKNKKLSVNVSFIPNISKVPRSYSSWLKKNMHTESSTALRRDTKQAMNRSSYMNEYDRITGILDKTIKRGHHDFDRLVARQGELKRLYNESFYHGIFRGKHDFLTK
jgi:hypothetical protein